MHGALGKKMLSEMTRTEIHTEIKVLFGTKKEKKPSEKGITLEQAKGLSIGQILYHKIDRNRDHTPVRWKVNGKVKRWKRDPDRIRVPLKYGINVGWYLKNDNLKDFALTEEEAMS